ncbi:MAG: carboxypeptidase-like regulatory domain-containing protein, partial [Muribaculaceae bacterium]|nr:carboxypeptidase-like regulatory domain-containing protein [Muribaculaceae bacterium]
MNTNPIKAEGRRSQLLRLLLPVLLLIFAAAPAAAQIVKGVVSDPSGEPLIGATIIEKGTTNGTATDIDGFFKLNLTDAKKAVLVVSYVGYATTEVEVKGQTDLNITLQEESSLLSEVVVVGYGQQKKESVVGAISQVNSGDLLETPSANLSQAITGKIPGVITSQSSGAPGADDASIYIRG